MPKSRFKKVPKGLPCGLAIAKKAIRTMVIKERLSGKKDKQKKGHLPKKPLVKSSFGKNVIW